MVGELVLQWLFFVIGVVCISQFVDCLFLVEQLGGFVLCVLEFGDVEGVLFVFVFDVQGIFGCYFVDMVVGYGEVDQCGGIVFIFELQDYIGIFGK